MKITYNKLFKDNMNLILIQNKETNSLEVSIHLEIPPKEIIAGPFFLDRITNGTANEKKQFTRTWKGIAKLNSIPIFKEV